MTRNLLAANNYHCFGFFFYLFPTFGLQQNTCGLPQTLYSGIFLVVLKGHYGMLGFEVRSCAYKEAP